MAPAKSLQHFRVVDYHLCNEFPIRILFWVPSLTAQNAAGLFLDEGRFGIKATSISFLHSKIKAMWIYTKLVWTWRSLWADRDMIFIYRAFHFQNMFSIGGRCFYTFFFKSSYLYLTFHVGRIPKSSGIEHMVDTKVFFVLYYKSPNFKGGRRPLKLLS